MRYLYLFAFLLVWLWAVPAEAGDPRLIPNPDKFSEAIMQSIAQGRLADVAKEISATAGVPEQEAAVEKNLQPLADKKVEYRKKVIDRDIAGALRQIVHYTFIKGLGFVYFRFNFKQTGSGWILAHFTFASEVNELFPPSMNIQ